LLLAILPGISAGIAQPSAAITRRKRASASCATGVKDELSTIVKIALGAAIDTMTPPPRASCTTTLHGRRSPICGSIGNSIDFRQETI